jgi:hypothetical protein
VQPTGIDYLGLVLADHEQATTGDRRSRTRRPLELSSRSSTSRATSSPRRLPARGPVLAVRWLAQESGLSECAA